MLTVDKAIEVDVPVREVYNQWTTFEEFPEFMHSVLAVTRRDDDILHWQVRVGTAHREWDAKILDQTPDELVAWRAIDGTANAGTVRFTALTPDRTRVELSLDVPAESWTDKVADALGILDTVVESDLARFKDYIEARDGDDGLGTRRRDVPDGQPGPVPAHARDPDTELDPTGAAEPLAARS